MSSRLQQQESLASSSNESTDRYGRRITSQPSSTYSVSEASSKSYRISTETGGEAEMTEEEVSNLVQKALRKARRATSPNKKKSFYPSTSMQSGWSDGNRANVGTSGGGGGENNAAAATTSPRSLKSGASSWSSVESTPSKALSPRSIPGTEGAENEGTLDLSIPQNSTLDTQQHMDALLAPTYDSNELRSHNSGDSVIRKVEEEILQARRAAEDANKRLAGALSHTSSTMSWNSADLVASPTKELADILDEHLEEDEGLREILDVSTATSRSANSANNGLDRAKSTPSSDFEWSDRSEKPVSLRYAVSPNESTNVRSKAGAGSVNDQVVASETSEDFQDAVEISYSEHEASIEKQAKETEGYNDGDQSVTQQDTAVGVNTETDTPRASAKGRSLPDMDTKVAAVPTERGMTTPVNLVSDGDDEIIEEEVIENEQEKEIVAQTMTEDSEFTEVTVEDDDDKKKSGVGIGFIAVSEDMNETIDEEEVGDEGTEYTEETMSDGGNSEYTEETIEEEIVVAGDDEEIIEEEILEEDEEILEANDKGKAVVDTEAEDFDARSVETPAVEEWTSADPTTGRIKTIIPSPPLSPVGSDGDGSCSISIVAVKVEVTHVADMKKEDKKKEEQTLKKTPKQQEEVPKPAPKPTRTPTAKPAPTLWWTKSPKHDPKPTKDETVQVANINTKADKDPANGVTAVAETPIIQNKTEVTGKTSTTKAPDSFADKNSEKEEKNDTNDKVASKTRSVLPPVSVDEPPASKGPAMTSPNPMTIPTPAAVDVRSFQTPRGAATNTPNVDKGSNRIQFRYPYPPMPALPKPRLTEDIIQEHASGRAEVHTEWSIPKQELADLLLAANDESIARRSNAGGALKILSLKKKNQLTLVRSRGFLETIVYAINQRIPSREQEAGLDARDRAVSTLLNVSGPKDNRTLVMGHPGLAKALVKVVRADIGESRVNACGTIAVLAKTPKNREALARVEGLLDCLALVLMEEAARPMMVSDEEKKEEDRTTTMSAASEILGSVSFTSSEAGSTTLDDFTDVRSVGASSSASSYVTRGTTKGPLGRPGVSIRRAKDEKQDEFVKRARMNACAALSHLAKECPVSVSRREEDSHSRRKLKTECHVASGSCCQVLPVVGR